MFENFLYRDVVLILKNNEAVRGIIYKFEPNFLTILLTPENNFECFIINISEINLIKIYRKQETEISAEQYEEIPIEQEKNPVRVAATISKKVNEFSMAMPKITDTNYEYPFSTPKFERKT